MSQRVLLEPAAETVCQENSVPPLIFELPPAEGRLVLEKAQDAPVFMYPAQVESSMVHTGNWGSIPVYRVTPVACQTSDAVSYTHLDVYKRQEEHGAAGVAVKHTMMTQRFEARPRWFYDRKTGVTVSGDPRLKPDEAFDLIRKAKEETELSILANMSGTPGKLESWGCLLYTSRCV